MLPFSVPLTYQFSPVEPVIVAVKTCVPLSATLAVAGLSVTAMAGITVKVKIFVAEVTPLPLAVMVIVWLVASVAELEGVSLMLPEVPVPGWVKVAVTPLGKVLVDRVTLPVKLVRVRVTATVCAPPP